MAGRLDFAMHLETAAFMSRLNNLTGSVLGFLGVAGGAAGLAYMFQRAARSGIEFNAVLEQQTVAFETLLGSQAAAAQRVRELIEFSAKTPFEMQEVIEASKILQAMGGSTLAGERGLRLVGDAAAAVGRDFRETAMWIGRLYGGLKSGTPVGEATMRLLEMGLISGDVKRRLDALGQSGGAVGDVMKILEQTFGGTGGAMEKQSRTFLGLWSTLKDNIAQGLGAFMQPVFAVMKDVLEKLVGFDWVGWGKSIGEGLAVIIDIFKEGKFWDSIKAGFEAVGYSIAGIISSNIYRGVLEGLSHLPPGVLKFIGLTSMPAFLSPAFVKAQFDAMSDEALARALGGFKSTSDALTGGGGAGGGAGGAGAVLGGTGGARDATALEKLGFISSGGGPFNTQERIARGVDRVNQWLEATNGKLDAYLNSRAALLNT